MAEKKPFNASIFLKGPKWAMNIEFKAFFYRSIPPMLTASIVMLKGKDTSRKYIMLDKKPLGAAKADIFKQICNFAEVLNPVQVRKLVLLIEKIK